MVRTFFLKIKRSIIIEDIGNNSFSPWGLIFFQISVMCTQIITTRFYYEIFTSISIIIILINKDFVNPSLIFHYHWFFSCIKKSNPDFVEII